MLVLFINSNLMKFDVRSFRLFFSSLQIQAVLDGNHKNNQLLLVFRKAPNLIFIFSSSIHDFPDGAICYIAVYNDDAAPYSK